MKILQISTRLNIELETMATATGRTFVNAKIAICFVILLYPKIGQSMNKCVCVCVCTVENCKQLKLLSWYDSCAIVLNVVYSVRIWPVRINAVMQFVN